MRVNSLEVEESSNAKDYLSGIAYDIQNLNISSEAQRIVNLRVIKNYEDYSDNQLVDLFVLDSDELAFNEIFNRYYEKIKRFALKKLADVDEAEDIVQEVFITLIRSLSSFRGESKFSTWLYAVTLNTIRMRLREKVKDRRSISIDNDDYINSINNIASKSSKNSRLNNPEDVYINKEFVEKLHQALESIPEKYKEVFVFRNINQLSNQEIADNLGISLAAVKSRVHRARQHLRINLNKY